MPSPIERMIDQATGFDQVNKYRPRNEADADAFIFRIDEKYFHVEIADKFAVMTAEKLKKLRDSMAEGQNKHKEIKALVKAIDDVLNQSIEDWYREKEEFEREEMAD